ncbi:MAG: hypothetical protein ACXU9A_08355 [Xanthobacteraceae bacterium]
MPDTVDLVALDEVEQARHVENVAERDVASCNIANEPVVAMAVKMAGR